MEATVEYALRRQDLREEFLEFLRGVIDKEVSKPQLSEVAADKE